MTITIEAASKSGIVFSLLPYHALNAHDKAFFQSP